MKMRSMVDVFPKEYLVSRSHMIVLIILRCSDWVGWLPDFLKNPFLCISIFHQFCLIFQYSEEIDWTICSKLIWIIHEWQKRAKANQFFDLTPSLIQWFFYYLSQWEPAETVHIFSSIDYWRQIWIVQWRWWSGDPIWPHICAISCCW